jgi:hypothetical protein
MKKTLNGTIGHTVKIHINCYGTQVEVLGLKTVLPTLNLNTHINLAALFHGGWFMVT